ncbi:hypothetical protein [Paenibacillus pabuli]|uniref:hypothetical protein n=1 Tax=Paenibacillus pabuli TaxID=1472 RepID=UPI001FFEFE2F|nr:hypothetical protein [Paenibacillus pabuli]UPK42460.1 hypothetical protein KET34_25215 [Paenibacillus pabuli]
MGIQDVAPAFRNPPTFQDFEEVKAYLKDNINKIARSLQDIDFMINGTLDVKNIRADGIEARNIKAGSITTEKIQAGAVVADKIDVGELSAISANLGHIVAGLIESVQIFGSYIATSRGYPRAEMSNTENMFGAYMSPSNYIQMYSPVGHYSPVLRFEAGGVPNYIFYDPTDNTFSITSSIADINISTSRDIQLYANSVRLAGWSILRNNGTGRSLDDELKSIDDRLKSLGG